MSIEEQRKRNRELMPNVAKMMDEWRAVFPGCRLIYAKDLETGHEVGTPTPTDRMVRWQSYEQTPQQSVALKGRRR
jgi:hypothetical protein